jgi:hypothetical protein
MELIMFCLVVIICISLNKVMGDKALDNGVWLVILIVAYILVDLT